MFGPASESVDFIVRIQTRAATRHCDARSSAFIFIQPAQLRICFQVGARLGGQRAKNSAAKVGPSAAGSLAAESEPLVARNELWRPSSCLRAAVTQCACSLELSLISLGRGASGERLLWPVIDSSTAKFEPLAEAKSRTKKEQVECVRHWTTERVKRILG